MSRTQKTDGTSRCLAQMENIKRQSLIYHPIFGFYKVALYLMNTDAVEMRLLALKIFVC